MGGALLERLPRGVRLTPMGRAFLPHAELAVRSAGQARRAAWAAAGAADGELHIASVHAVAMGVLPETFARWRRAHPGMRLTLREYASAGELADHMDRGVADLAVGHRPPHWQGPVEPVGSEEIVIAVAAADPLARRDSVRLAELADRPWVRCALEPIVAGRPAMDAICERAGFTPRNAVHTEHTSTAVRMARAGAGVVAAPAHVIAGIQGCVGLRVDSPIRRELVVFSRAELVGAARAFVAELRRTLPGASAGAPAGGTHAPRTTGATAPTATALTATALTATALTATALTATAPGATAPAA